MKTVTVKRKELKFYISYHEYLILKNVLSKFMKKDKYSQNNEGYSIRSLYFDNLSNREFEDKMSGVERRSKYRMRIYDTKTKKVKFEIKRKLNENIQKETATISRDDAIQVQEKNYEVLLKYNDPTLNKIYVEFKKSRFIPVVMVDYTREAFVADYNNIRIVFDKNLKTSSTQLDLFGGDFFSERLKKGLVVMEVKYDNFLPDWIKNIIRMPSADRSAISKYCIGRLNQYESVF